jgi:hypothetical integral membrane protein (TIGR02206 family)
MNELPFVLFGTTHLLALATIVGLCAAVVLRPPPPQDPIVRAAALVLLVLALVKPVVFIGIYGQPWQTSLPLDLCRINEFISVYMLLARSFRAFELAYFLAIAGSVAALITPDLQHGFPEPRFLMFFVSHGLSVVAVVYAIAGFGFRPTLRSVGITLVFLGLYTVAMAGVNVLLDANYLFLREKPEGASILDALGPWPWYVIWLICLAMVLCLVCYLPFAVHRRISAR